MIITVAASWSLGKEGLAVVWGVGMNEAGSPPETGRWVCSAFVRASVLLPWVGGGTLLVAQERGSSVIRLRPQSCPRNPNVRRFRREIALGKQDSRVVTGRRVHW